MFESRDRLVVIDQVVPKPKRPFVKLHEAGHGYMPHQCRLYSLMHDCQKTLDPDTTDLFEREANVFASEVLFQGDTFTDEAAQFDFGQKVAMRLAKRYGASNYSTYPRYVTTNRDPCCLVVLNPPYRDEFGQVIAEVRRVIVSVSFAGIYEASAFSQTITRLHPLAPAIPIPLARRIVDPQEIWLMDRNGTARAATIESFNTTHQVLVLLRDKGIVKPKRVFVPKKCC